LVAAALASFVAGCAPASAGDAWPGKPLRLVVPQAAGGPADVRARQIAEGLAKSLGQPVVVENRPGAGGTIGADVVAKAPPDGYALLYGTISDQSIAPAFYPNLPYDPRKDFAPITQNSTIPAVLVVHAGSGLRSIQELIAKAKARPGELTLASYDNGTLTQPLLLQMNREAGVAITHVPYKNPTAGLTDVAAGPVTMMFDYYLTSRPFIESGKVVPLMIVDDRRIGSLPAVPAAAEVGLPSIKHIAWSGILAPAGTPRAIVARLHAELVKTLRSPELARVFAESGGETVANSPEEFAAFIAKERAELAELVRATGAKPE